MIKYEPKNCYVVEVNTAIRSRNIGQINLRNGSPIEVQEKGSSFLLYIMADDIEDIVNSIEGSFIMSVENLGSGIVLEYSEDEK